MLVIDELMQKIDDTHCPVVVGLDPVIQRIPQVLIELAASTKGRGVVGVCEAIWHFNRILIDALHPLIPAVKLQSACYEMYGAVGRRLFEKTVALAMMKNLMVIDDAKRNDVGNTARIYADAHLGLVPLAYGKKKRIPKPHFLTVNPFLGDDSLLPFLDVCKQADKGLFVLVRTSNPSSDQYQTALVDNKPLYKKIAADINRLTDGFIGRRGFSPLGAVVGATWPEEAQKLRKIMPHSYFLVPGYGAQGGTAEQATCSFDENGYGALINSSRAIIFAYEEQKNQKGPVRPDDFGKSAKRALIKMRDEILSALSSENKLPSNW